MHKTIQVMLEMVDSAKMFRRVLVAYIDTVPTVMLATATGISISLEEKISRYKGRIFCHVIRAPDRIQGSFLFTSINQEWKGAAPIFRLATMARMAAKRLPLNKNVLASRTAEAMD